VEENCRSTYIDSPLFFYHSKASKYVYHRRPSWSSAWTALDVEIGILEPLLLSEYHAGSGKQGIIRNNTDRRQCPVVSLAASLRIGNIVFCVVPTRCARFVAPWIIRFRVNSHRLRLGLKRRDNLAWYQGHGANSGEMRQIRNWGWIGKHNRQSGFPLADFSIKSPIGFMPFQLEGADSIVNLDYWKVSPDESGLRSFGVRHITDRTPMPFGTEFVQHFGVLIWEVSLIRLKMDATLRSVTRHDTCYAILAFWDALEILPGPVGRSHQQLSMHWVRLIVSSSDEMYQWHWLTGGALWSARSSWMLGMLRSMNWQRGKSTPIRT